MVVTNEELNALVQKKQELVRQIDSTDGDKTELEDKLASITDEITELQRKIETEQPFEPVKPSSKDLRNKLIDSTVEFMKQLIEDPKLRKQVAMQTYYRFKEELSLDKSQE